MLNAKFVIGLLIVIAIVVGAIQTTGAAARSFLDLPSAVFVLGICLPMGWMAGKGDVSLALRKMGSYAVSAGWCGTMLGMIALLGTAGEDTSALPPRAFAFACVPTFYAYTLRLILGFASDVIRSDSPEQR